MPHRSVPPRAHHKYLHEHLHGLFELHDSRLGSEDRTGLGRLDSLPSKKKKLAADSHSIVRRENDLKDRYQTGGDAPWGHKQDVQHSISQSLGSVDTFFRGFKGRGEKKV